INKIGEQYELRLPLPHVEVNKVNMTKRGDQLFIEIGNFRREMILPSLLADRPAVKAMFRNGELVVQFGAATPLEV
nr:ArsA family ATPase [Herpetosiphonaceae bacterium]